MKLWILRHGEAEGHARTDAERNLTEHGRAEVLRSAAHLIGQPLSLQVSLGGCFPRFIFGDHDGVGLHPLGKLPMERWTDPKTRFPTDSRERNQWIEDNRAYVKTIAKTLTIAFFLNYEPEPSLTLYPLTIDGVANHAQEIVNQIKSQATTVTFYPPATICDSEHALRPHVKQGLIRKWAISVVENIE